MQHLLNEDEYQEYLELKKINSPEEIHKKNVLIEKEVEEIINSFYIENEILDVDYKEKVTITLIKNEIAQAMWKCGKLNL